MKRGIVDETLGISRKDLAIALGVNPITVSRWFSKERKLELSMSQTKILMEITNKTLDELIIIFE